MDAQMAMAIVTDHRGHCCCSSISITHTRAPHYRCFTFRVSDPGNSRFEFQNIKTAITCRGCHFADRIYGESDDRTIHPGKAKKLQAQYQPGTAGDRIIEY